MQDADHQRDPACCVGRVNDGSRLQVTIAVSERRWAASISRPVAPVRAKSTGCAFRADIPRVMLHLKLEDMEEKRRSPLAEEMRVRGAELEEERF